MDRIGRCFVPAALVLAMVLIPPLLGTCSALAQSKATTGTSATTTTSTGTAASTTGQTTQTATTKVRLTKPSVASTPAEQAAEKYASEGWSVIGPAKIQSADSKEIKLYGPKKDLKISLEGKNLTVVSPDTGTAASAASLQPDTTVYICQLERDVVVILSPQTAKMREQRNDR